VCNVALCFIIKQFLEVNITRDLFELFLIFEKLYAWFVAYTTWYTLNILSTATDMLFTIQSSSSIIWNLKNIYIYIYINYLCNLLVRKLFWFWLSNMNIHTILIYKFYFLLIYLRIYVQIQIKHRSHTISTMKQYYLILQTELIVIFSIFFQVTYTFLKKNIIINLK